jgi:hypothetical protein
MGPVLAQRRNLKKEQSREQSEWGKGAVWECKTEGQRGEGTIMTM